MEVFSYSCFQVLMDSIDRVFEFLKRSKAVSPTVALETATALQVMLSLYLTFGLFLIQKLNDCKGSHCLNS